MALIPGTKLGPYEIVSLAGAGGMGEVYHARDTRLGRDVAIKVLPEALASDADRLRRCTIRTFWESTTLVRRAVRRFWSANFWKDKPCGKSSYPGRCRFGERSNMRSASRPD